ncbi:MAG: hypothetical protein OYL97_09325 [Candidatus Poribacteria bacterium]|nr:hypothetical protein [Candidatus Poribacteria bacterium]
MSSFFEFSLTDAIGALASVILAILAIYAIWKKPWRENLAGHFKKAYRERLKSIQKAVKERDALREEVDTLSIFHRNYTSLEEAEEIMRAEDGFPSVNDMGKQLWDGNKESLLKGLEEIEHIKNSKDAEKVLSNYSQMDYISRDLFEEVIRLRELRSLSKTGKITGNVMLTQEFTKDFPKQSQFQNPVRFKPEYIRDGYISQFWLSRNPFYPNDPDTGKKAKKRDFSKNDNWWLLSMDSPYWKYVEFIDFNFEDYIFIHRDGRRENMSPEDYQLPDGTKLSDWKNRMFPPLKFGKDEED